MKTLPRMIFATVFCASGMHAQNIWNGAGVSGGTAGADWTDGANYTGAPTFGSTTDLKFSTITEASGGVTLFAGTGGVYAVKDLYFGDTTTLGTGQTSAQAITLSGNGTAGQTTLNLSGYIYMPSYAVSKITLGSDLTLNLSDAAHQINFKVNNNVTAQHAPSPVPVAVIKSLVTGGGANATLTARYSGYGNGQFGSAAMVFTNDANSFVAVQNRFDNYVGYTSIKNVGEGASSLGDASTEATGTITLGNGGQLNYLGSVNQTTNRNIVGGSTNTLGNASAGTTVTFNGTMTYGSPTGTGFGLRANVASGATLVINSAIADNPGAGSPNASISKQGSSGYYDADGNLATNNGGGMLVLGGNNSFSGAVTVSAGTVRAAHANALGNTTGATTVSSGATLDVHGQSVGAENVTINGAGVGGVGALTNGSSTAASLAGGVTLSGNATIGATGNLKLSGVIGQSGGTRTLTKVGDGELKLNGVNTYTGATTISAGALGGVGSISTGAVTFASGTTLNPGDGSTIGQFSFGGNLALNAGTTFSVSINQAAGTDYDRVAVAGTTALNGAALALAFGEDFAASAEIGQTFNILTSVGALSGQLGQGASISATADIYNYDFGISYAGNTVTLTLNGISSVPEPSAWALVFGGAALGFASLRRRRRS